MSRLHIRHDTLYTFDRPVHFGVWRLLMRPLDSHALRLVDASLAFEPFGDTRWSYDAYGNSICYFTPDGPSDRLRVISSLLIDRFPASLTVANPCSVLPIVYNASDRAVLSPYIAPATPDDDPNYLDWVRSHLGSADEPAMTFLQRLNQAIHDDFSYRVRGEVGTQGPAETVASGQGACRDFAWLMIESLRRLGFAARFATGYIYSARTAQIRGAGSTHAWCEVFLPDLGWVEFDPTNALTESPDLIRVATTRTPEEASPMNGVVLDQASCNLNVEVDVLVADQQDYLAA